MKAYFTASVVGKKNLLSSYLLILNTLHKFDVSTTADHILNATEAQIRLETRAQRLAFHDNLEKWIAECDFLVAEASFPSISVGYEISLALQRAKPVLVLYNNCDPPSLFASHHDERLVCECYSDESLPGIIKDFLGYIKGASDARFTFFITSKQNAHLEKRSKQQKIAKSVYLRSLIDKDMKI